MQFYGQFELDRFLYENYLKEIHNGFFIECGAVDGVLEITCLSFEKSMGWTGINIEPALPNFERLKINRPNCINLNIALSDNNGVCTFKHAIHPSMGDLFGNGSITHTKDHLSSLVRDGCKFKDYQVKTMTYKSLIEENNVQKLDLFVLDVEGHEIQVINGMGDCKVLPKVLCIEHGHLGLEVLKKYLEPKGYLFDKIHVNNAVFLLKE